MSEKRLKPYPNINFTCDKCQEEFEEETAYSFAYNFTQLEKESYYTYCAECVKASKKNKKVRRKSKKSLTDNRITGRTRQLNLKVTEETYWLLKKLALKEKCLMTEVVEKSLGRYKEKR